MLAMILDSLAAQKLSLGFVTEARAHWSECLAIAVPLDNTWLTIHVLNSMAELVLADHNPQLTLRLVAAGEVARKSIGAVLPPQEHAMIDRMLALARKRVSSDVADTAWREGQMMTLRQVVDLFPSRLTPIARLGSRRASPKHPARHR